MRFGPVSLGDALGHILAHSVSLPDGRLRKGIELAAPDLQRLKEAGHTEVTVARLNANDMAEDAAALKVAKALVPDPAKANLRLSKAFTGRVNLYATCRGIVDLDVPAIHGLNRVHPMITLATESPYARTREDGLVGTVKIIAYGVPEQAVDQACHCAAAAINIRPAIFQTASLILTRTENNAAPGEGKGIASIRRRLTALGVDLAEVRIARHNALSLAKELQAAQGQFLLILTASATSDIADVAPSALVQAGGKVTRFGMPVDPGNLLFFGQLSKKPVIGLPGCAKSPALNGADWVMERLLCGVNLSEAAIAAMGVGGLLKEIPSRPQPRERSD